MYFLWSSVLIISRCFRGGVMKATADVPGGALLLRMKNALREYILYYQCRIFTCFHSQVHQTLVKNQTWSNLRLAALFKWYLRRSGVLLSLVPACQCPGGHGGHGWRDWEVAGKEWHLVQVCGVASFTRAVGSSKDFHDRPSLIYIVSFPNLTSSRFKPVQVIFPIWLSTWFCDFARWCSST